MEEAANKYNGWTNYETWCVALWLDNDEGSYHHWQATAAEIRDDATNCHQVLDGIWTAEEAVRFNLADRIESEVTEASPISEPTLYNDLLTAALSEVDWLEIADAILQRLGMLHMSPLRGKKGKVQTEGLGEQLRRALLAQPESINKIALRAGVDQSTLNKFVRGQRKNLRSDTVDRLCAVLNIRPAIFEK